MPKIDFLGVDGIKGTIADMRELGVWDTFQVKTQTIKTAIESACMLLRIDDIVSGLQNKWCVCCDKGEVEMICCNMGEVGTICCNKVEMKKRFALTKRK